MLKIGLISLFAIIVLVGGVLILGCDTVAKKCFGAQILGEEALAQHVPPSVFKEALESGKYKLIDVRTKEEYAQGHIKNAIQKDYYKTQEFLGFLNSLDKNGKYLIYCRTDKRSSKTLEIMKEKGFKNVSDMTGGYNGWVTLGYPTEK